VREPPFLLEAFLRRCLRRAPSADSVVGDLREEYARRMAGAGALRASVWYVWQAVAIGGAFVRDAVVARLRRGRRGRWVSLSPGLTREVRLAMRSLARAPGFAVVAVFTLALGIGVNAGAFAFVDALAFRPLPVQSADRLVAMFGEQRDEHLQGFSYGDLLDYRDGTSGVLEAVAGFTDGPASLSAGGEAVMVWYELASPDYFRVLQPGVERGRLLAPDDEFTVVLSSALWRSRFDADPGIVGRTIQLNGYPFTIVGVAGQGFTGTRLFSYAPQLWVPLRAHTRLIPGSEGWMDLRGNGWLSMVGRMRPGATLQQVEAAANATAARLSEEYAETHAGRSIRILSNRSPINPFAFEPGVLRSAAFATLLGVALVLIIACANVANLMLARGSAKARELAVRAALGGSRLHVMSAPLVESLVVGLCGGLLGIVIAYWTLHASAGWLPPLDFAPSFDPRVDWRVIGFAFTAALVSGTLAGILPALRASESDPASTLRATSGASHRSRLLEALVVAQVAFSVLALVGAALFTRSLRNTRAIDPGFRMSNGLTLTLDPGLRGQDESYVRDFYDRLLERTRALPGVRSVSRASFLPLDGNNDGVDVTREGEEIHQDGLSASLYVVDPGFYSVLGVPVLEGREFRDGDDSASGLVAVVNRTLAERLWPGRSPLGRRIQAGGRTAEIVGVVGDTKVSMLNEPPRNVLAMSLRQRYRTQTTLLIRTSGDPAALAPAVRRVVSEIDPTLALIGLKTLEAGAKYTITAAESGARGGTLFGILALLLSVAGLYGVLSYSVARRSREIGIRIALGARTQRVVGLIVGRGLRLASIGILIGLIGSAALSSVLAGLLYGVDPLDPVSFGGPIAIMLGVSAIASWLPAIRAASLDPIDVIRSD
jgi:putative ABC transport system permease protein